MKSFVITGGIGVGKSAVTVVLSKMGFPVIDADAVARQVVQPGQEGLRRLVETFGPNILDATGNLDRPAMRARIASDGDAQRRIGLCLHPLIRNEIQSRLEDLSRSGHDYAFVEAALAIESGSYVYYDALILVTADQETRVRRVMRRDNLAEDAVRALIARQMPEEDKAKLAQHIISNNGTPEELQGNVMSWVKANLLPQPS